MNLLMQTFQCVGVFRLHEEYGTLQTLLTHHIRRHGETIPQTTHKLGGQFTHNLQENASVMRNNQLNEA